MIEMIYIMIKNGKHLFVPKKSEREWKYLSQEYTTAAFMVTQYCILYWQEYSEEAVLHHV